jgi:xanthine dehydrogenase small subunit
MKISFTLNDTPICVETSPNRRVVDLLREDLGFTGTKEGCGTGECGACTLLVDGGTRLSCLMVAAQLEGRRLTTIEGVAPEGTLHPVQASLVHAGAVQCGFCTPGMVLTAVDLLEKKPHPTRGDIADAISGNICRCTGYVKILDAVEDASSHGASHPKFMYRANQTHDLPSPRIHPSLTNSIEDDATVFLPESLTDLWRVLSEHPDARVFSGGTDLLVWIRNRRIRPNGLICLERIKELSTISETDEGVWIGAGTSLSALPANAMVKRRFPVLTQAIQTLGSPHIRNMGTLGGNIMTASPAGDTLPPLLVLGATVEVASAEGVRLIPIETFIEGPGRTGLKKEEILTRVFIPMAENITLQHFEKVGLRNALACSVASLAAMMRISDAGIIETAGLAWGSVAPTVIRIPEVEAALKGKTLDFQSIKSVIPLVHAAVSPIDDVRASAAYRRQVAANLLFRLLTDAASRPDSDARKVSAYTEERNGDD